MSIDGGSLESVTTSRRSRRAPAIAATAALALLLPAMPSKALAQGLGVRPLGLETRSEGLQWGPFMLHPSVGLDFYHDSNVLYASEDLPEGSVVGSGVLLLRPRLVADLPVGRQRFRMAYAPTLRTYTEALFDQTDPVSHFADLEAILRLGNSVGLTARGHMVRGTVEAPSVIPGGELLFQFVPYRSNNPELGLSVDLGGRHVVSATIRGEESRFDGGGSEVFFDTTARGLDARYSFRVSPVTSLQVFHDARQTEQDREQLLFSRLEVSDRTTGVTLRRALNQAVIGQFTVGYESMDFVGGSDDHFRGPIVDLTATWSLSDVSRLEAAARRRPYQSFFANNNYFLGSGISLRWTRQVGRTVFVQTGVTAYWNRYSTPLDIATSDPAEDTDGDGLVDGYEYLAPSIGVKREDRAGRIDLGVGYRLRQNLQMFMGYNAERRDSNIVADVGGATVGTFDFSVNRLFIRFEVGWL